MFWESRSFTSGPLYTNCAHSGGRFTLVGLFLKLPPHRACSMARSSSPTEADTTSSWPLCLFGEGHCQYTQGLLKRLSAFVHFYLVDAGLTSKKPGSREPAGISPFDLPCCTCDVISLIKMLRPSMTPAAMSWPLKDEAGFERCCLLLASFVHPGPIHMHFGHSYANGIKSAVSIIQIQMILFLTFPGKRNMSQ